MSLERAEDIPNKNILRDSLGRIKWKQLSSDPELLKQLVQRAALEIYVAEGALTSRSLINQDRIDLGYPINRLYPGSWGQLRVDLEISETEEVKRRASRNSWNNTVRIETEAQRLFQEHGVLSGALLRQVGREDLLNAIFRYYPGRLKALQDKLQQDKAFTREDANDDLEQLFEQEGKEVI